MAIKDNRTLHEKQITYWLYKILLGLDQLHARNILHKQVCKEYENLIVPYFLEK